MSTAYLPVQITNNSTSTTAYCYVTGYDISSNFQLMLLTSDGKTKYYPPSPPSNKTNQPLPQDCAIPLAAPGQSITISLPHIGGCRVWFCTHQKLTFGLNPGPALVEPSVTNNSDPNINLNWSFIELTFNAQQLFANISCVDFVSNLPTSLTLTNTSGGVNHVSGMPVNGLANVCRALKAQAAKDGQPWGNLIIEGSNGQALRVLSPNNAMVGNANLFAGYFDAYVNSVWQEFSSGKASISCNTQAQWGVVSGSVNANSTLCFDNGNAQFAKPSTQDIFSCSTGAFANGSQEQLCITPRLSAALNRATLAVASGALASQSSTIPDPAGPASFYQWPICNHHARIVHEHLLDGRGYAFPYDDVCQDGGPDQCGAVYDGSPQLLTIAIGGNGAYVTPGAPGAPVQ